VTFGLHGSVVKLELKAIKVIRSITSKKKKNKLHHKVSIQLLVLHDVAKRQFCYKKTLKGPLLHAVRIRLNTSVKWTHTRKRSWCRRRVSAVVSWASARCRQVVTVAPPCRSVPRMTAVVTRRDIADTGSNLSSHPAMLLSHFHTANFLSKVTLKNLKLCDCPCVHFVHGSASKSTFEHDLIVKVTSENDKLSKVDCSHYKGWLSIGLFECEGGLMTTVSQAACSLFFIYVLSLTLWTLKIF